MDIHTKPREHQQLLIHFFHSCIHHVYPCGRHVFPVLLLHGLLYVHISRLSMFMKLQPVPAAFLEELVCLGAIITSRLTLVISCTHVGSESVCSACGWGGSFRLPAFVSVRATGWMQQNFTSQQIIQRSGKNKEAAGVVMLNFLCGYNMTKEI